MSIAPIGPGRPPRGLPGASGRRADLGVLPRSAGPPEGGEGPPTEDGAWKRLAQFCTVRRTHSVDRLFDLSAFYLHRNAALWYRRAFDWAAERVGGAVARPPTRPCRGGPAARS